MAELKLNPEQWDFLPSSVSLEFMESAARLAYKLHRAAVADQHKPPDEKLLELIQQPPKLVNLAHRICLGRMCDRGMLYPHITLVTPQKLHVVSLEIPEDVTAQIGLGSCLAGALRMSPFEAYYLAMEVWGADIANAEPAIKALDPIDREDRWEAVTIAVATRQSYQLNLYATQRRSDTGAVTDLTSRADLTGQAPQEWLMRNLYEVGPEP